MLESTAYQHIEGMATQPSRWLIGPPPPKPWGALAARALGLLITCLCIYWVQQYNGGVGLHPRELTDGGNDTGPIFCWHPILMLVAFAVFMAEAVLTYQAPLVPGISRSVLSCAGGACTVRQVGIAARIHCLPIVLRHVQGGAQACALHPAFLRARLGAAGLVGGISVPQPQAASANSQLVHITFLPGHDYHGALVGAVLHRLLVVSVSEGIAQ